MLRVLTLTVETPWPIPFSELIWILRILRTVNSTLWTGDQLVARLLPTQDDTNTEKTQTYVHFLGFEPTIQMFERAEVFHALDVRPTYLHSEIQNA
jgi:hypothetical protein